MAGGTPVDRKYQLAMPSSAFLIIAGRLPVFAVPSGVPNVENPLKSNIFDRLGPWLGSTKPAEIVIIIDSMLAIIRADAHRSNT